MTIFRRIFCLTVPKDFIGEHFGVPEKFFYRKISCIGGGRSITVLSNFFVSQYGNEKLCKGTLCFPEVFWYRKKVMEKKGLSRFSVENFMSDSAENFRDRILLFYCFWEKFGFKKFHEWKGGITFFSRKVLVSHCRKYSSENPTVFEKKLGFKKFFGWKGGYQILPSESFGLRVPKNFVSIPSMFQKN